MRVRDSFVRARLVLVCGVAAGLLAGCGGDGAVEFWNGLRFDGDEVEQYSTLTEMTEAADAVVVGHYTSFAMGRQILGDERAPQGSVSMLTGMFEVSETLAGSIREPIIPIEFVLVERGEPVAETGARLSESFPDGDLVVFLRAKGGNEEGYFRLVNSTGLWTESGFDSLAAPLAGDPQQGVGPYDSELSDVDSLSDFIALVRRIEG